MIENHCEDLKTANKGNTEKPTPVVNKEYRRPAKPTPSVNGEKTRPNDSFHRVLMNKFQITIVNIILIMNKEHDRQTTSTIIICG